VNLRIELFCSECVGTQSRMASTSGRKICPGIALDFITLCEDWKKHITAKKLFEWDQRSASLAPKKIAPH